MHKFVPLLFLTVLCTTTRAQDSLTFGGVYDLPGLEVKASYEPLSPLAQSFTIEEVYRLPSTFYDPARLIALLPGVAQSNDQANHLSVRGNSPNKNRWRLNGLAIVNPNHTANAGTFYDFPTLNGGGVNAISAQMLGNSGFYSAGLPIEYGNATGGTFDLQLRPGSKTNHIQQAQAGLIGFDLAAEGPIGRGGLSYLVNGRYSFTGLLGDAGVDFGGETIRFADLNAHLHYTGARSQVSVFGIYGQSSNRFAGVDPAEEEITEQKELFDIDFEDQMLILGASYDYAKGDHDVSIGMAFSQNAPNRGQQFSRFSPGGQSVQIDLSNELFSALGKYTYSFTDAFSASAGVELYSQVAESRVTVTSPDDGSSGEERVTDYSNWSPFLAARLFAGPLKIDLGLRQDIYVLASGTTKHRTNPRLAITLPVQRGEVSLVSEFVSQLITTADLYTTEFTDNPLAPQTAQINLSYGRRIGRVFVRGAAFAQRTADEPAATVDGFLYSANNLLEVTPFFAFDTVADTRRIGLELEAAGGQKDQGLYYRGSLTLFNAKTEQTEGTYADDRFSTNFIAKATVGREWAGQDRKERDRILGFNLALIARGGERYGEIVDVPRGDVNDVALGPYFLRPRLTNGFVNQLNTYFRPDLRLYKTKTRQKTTTTLALDLQNVAGIENQGNIYYDTFLGQPNDRFQLGLIPVLSYRIVWR